MNRHLVAPAIAEFSGSFFLIFAGTGAIIVGADSRVPDHTGIALVFGLVIMVLIYSLGKISGAHFNPAVTLAFLTARQIDLSRTAAYLLAQFAAAVCASSLLKLLLSPKSQFGQTHSAEFWIGFAAEFLLTGLLMLVILSVTTGRSVESDSAAPAIGGTVALAALFAGPVSGASLNPARSFGPALAAGDFHQLWLYFAAPILGAQAAVLLCRIIHRNRTPDCCGGNCSPEKA